VSPPQVEALLVVVQAKRRRALPLQSGRASTKDSCKNAPSPGFLFLATAGSSAGEFVCVGGFGLLFAFAREEFVAV
jgi:hypothetical protein